jgi:membrane-bound lytic murein transglycosylase F
MDPATLPRRGYSLDLEIDLARRLARSLGLDPVVVTVAERHRMYEALLEGRGDLVVAGVTVTDERLNRFAFSVPLGHVRELLVCRAADLTIRSPEDLAGKRIAVRASSSYYGTLTRLREMVPEIDIVLVPEHMDTEQLIFEVGRREYDATVADDDIFEEVLAYRDDLRAPFALTRRRPVAWALRPDSLELKAAADRFLQQQALTSRFDEIEFGDLDAVRERRVLRVLTRNSAAAYFLYRGEQLGFEFELARDFARSIGCRIRVIVPPSHDLLIPWLLEGRGDVIAAAMTITPDRADRVAFTRPYNRVSEVVVASAADDTLDDLFDLSGRTLTVRKSSSYHRTLAALRQEVDFTIEEAPEYLDTETLIARVADGTVDLTVADSNILDIELTYRDTVRGALVLGEPSEIAWAVRPEDGRLREAADAYLAQAHRGAFYNGLQEKYFRSKRHVARMMTARPGRHGRISDYDDLFRQHARGTGIDWRLLAAQCYQESRFDPQAESWAGALGLMQVLPGTAREMGVEGDLRDPEAGVRAGALYLSWLMDRFEPSLPPSERLLFALAAYNAGRGHILDGRQLARERGLDPDRWFDNVEAVLPLLMQGSYAARSRFGYCRCTQPVAYVREIMDRYAAFVSVMDRAEARAGF